jgi:hypothetical protein
MNNIIQTIDENTFTMKARGNDYTLINEGNRWAMYVVNASVRAWNNGYAIPKHFDTLEQVEAKYKSWKGISQLLGRAK